ncbi:luciferase family protein [Streptomyces sp. NPDC048279]|uniref:luciferase domain-containing protein n=1 Tax=Streptomyces sp. NPDC048279 TaxID=3154714 RepID=UPI00343AE6DA
MSAERAMELLRAWPGLTWTEASCGTGCAMCSQGCEIVHFHSTSDADLHLTGRMIRRLGDQLRRSTAIRLLPESQWVTVHLDNDADTDTLLSLVSAALQAHTACAGAAPGCNWNRVTFPDRRDDLVS